MSDSTLQRLLGWLIVAMVLTVLWLSMSGCRRAIPVPPPTPPQIIIQPGETFEFHVPIEPYPVDPNDCAKPGGINI